MREVAEKILTASRECDRHALANDEEARLEAAQEYWDVAIPHAVALAEAYLSQQETLKAREEELREVREENVRLRKLHQESMMLHRNMTSAEAAEYLEYELKSVGGEVVDES